MKLKTYRIHHAIAEELAAVHTLLGHGCALISAGESHEEYYIDTWLGEDDLRLLTSYAAALHIYLQHRAQHADAMWCVPARMLHDPDYELALTHLGIPTYCAVPTEPLDAIAYVGEIEDYRDTLHN